MKDNMLSVGILGAAGYTGGELIRVLLNHPQVKIVFANSESNAGNLVSDVHEGLIGETDLKFTSEMPFDKVDVVFFCFGHGKSEQFLKEHTISASRATMITSMVCLKHIRRLSKLVSIWQTQVALLHAFNLPCFQH